MKDPIRIGIVGLGRAGEGFHVPDMLQKSDMYQIVAACDIIADRADRVAHRCGCRAYYDLDALLADDNVEMVDIATRSCDHYEHALRTIAAGKDVMMEKPVCMSAAELSDILSKTNKPGLPHFIMRHNRRFEPGFLEMKKIIDSGILGHVFEVTLSQNGYQWRDDWQTIAEYGGGQMLNWGPHLIDHALRFLNSPVKRMHCDSIQAVAGGDCEDHFSIRMTGENGRFVTVSVSGASACNQGRIYTAIGTRGEAVMKENKIHLRYIDPTMLLPKIISSSDTPGAAFGTSGTFEAAQQPTWVTEDREVGVFDNTLILDYIYESYRNGVEYPIRDSEILMLMEVITSAKEQAIISAETIE